MIDRKTRLRFRRKLRKSRRQALDVGSQAEDQLEKHFIRRMERLFRVRRFVLSWLALVALIFMGLLLQLRALQPFYQTLQPVPGGVFREGVLGSFTNANPLYATAGVDGSVSRLIFAGLMKYNRENELVTDLAHQLDVDERGLVYTATLRQNLRWHDGEPLTADDVVFTFKSIQNPDTKSPFFEAWKDIKIDRKDERTVTFTLPSALTAFPLSLTTGIVPEHILGSTPPSQLRSANFNTAQPIGAGPFRFEALEVTGDTPESRQERIGLLPYNDYHFGAPKMQRFIIRAYRNEDAMVKAFLSQEINAIAGLRNLPEEISDEKAAVHHIPLTGQTAVFFKISEEGPLAEKPVRQALVRAVNTGETIGHLGYSVVPSRSPLLPVHVGYDADILQLEHDIDEARRLLDEAGWVVGDNSTRVKDDAELSFRFMANNTPDAAIITHRLQQQWSEIGINAEVILQTDDDFQNTVTFREYDALLYSISLGIDPDIFPYWHSSQADMRASVRLNFSEYKSSQADRALEEGRTRSADELRAVKYKPFLQAWREDAPALTLYQPRYLYITGGEIHNFEPSSMNIGVDRYSNVHEWFVRQQRVSL